MTAGQLLFRGRCESCRWVGRALVDQHAARRWASRHALDHRTHRVVVKVTSWGVSTLLDVVQDGEL